MKIERRDNTTIKFGEVPFGEVFTDEYDTSYIKVEDVYGIQTDGNEQEYREHYNAVAVSTGEFNLFDAHYRVKHRKTAYMVIP